MKKQYIAPASTSICYLEALQPLCGSTVEEATHNWSADEED